MSPLGPLAFFSTPSTVKSIASGCVPWNTVYATPFMPALMSDTGIVNTLPVGGPDLASVRQRAKQQLRIKTKRVARRAVTAFILRV